MGSYGEASLKKIWGMLDRCASGWIKTETDHYFCITWKAKTYPSFPKGKHGSKNKGQKQAQASVEVGHIRHMVRQLEIDEKCAKKHLPVLQ